MKLTTSLQDMRPAISPCLRCNGCTYGPWPQNHTFCPLFSRDQCYTFSAGGLLFLSKALLTGQIDYSQSVADLAFQCPVCRACDGKCVIVRCINPDMALSDIIRLLRYELVKRGIVPKGPIKKMFDEVKKHGDVRGDGKKKIPEKVRDDKADTLLVADSLFHDTKLNALNAGLQLLAKMKKPVALFTDAGSLGSTLYDFGFWDELPGLVEKKWKEIKGFGKKKLLFIDPHCQEFMTNKYEKIMDNFTPLKSRHISEVLLDAFNKGTLKSKKNNKVKVSYHDACFLGRGLGIYEPPRQVLGHLNGVQLVEMTRNREQALCCGARGLGNYFENFAEGAAKERIDEFMQTKADLLITACAHCKDIFASVLGSQAHRVKDFTEFVRERVE